MMINFVNSSVEVSTESMMNRITINKTESTGMKINHQPNIFVIIVINLSVVVSQLRHGQ